MFELFNAKKRIYCSMTAFVTLFHCEENCIITSCHNGFSSSSSSFWNRAYCGHIK